MVGWGKAEKRAEKLIASLDKHSKYLRSPRQNLKMRRTDFGCGRKTVKAVSSAEAEGENVVHQARKFVYVGPDTASLKIIRCRTDSEEGEYNSYDWSSREEHGLAS